MIPSEHPSCQTRICHLTFTLGRKRILNDISFKLCCHQFSAVIGTNGAGKTSLLRCLTGEYKGSGQIFFKNEKHPPKIGYVPQKLHFDKDNPITALDLFLLAHSKRPIWLIKKHQDEEIFRKALVAVRAEHLIHRKIATLSGGEQQRVVLALALAGNPELLLLDEPDTGVDEQGLHLFYSVLADLKTTYDISILISSHNFRWIQQYADQVFLLDHGCLVNSGSPQHIFKSTHFSRIFGAAGAVL